jgi:hypothetical protein
MELRQEQCPAPADLALETVHEWALWLTETVHEWALWLTEVERWLMPHFPHREARWRAWGVVRHSHAELEPVQTAHGDPLLARNRVQQVDLIGFKENRRITELIDGVHDGATAGWF